MAQRIITKAKEKVTVADLSEPVSPFETDWCNHSYILLHVSALECSDEKKGSKTVTDPIRDCLPGNVFSSHETNSFLSLISLE